MSAERIQVFIDGICHLCSAEAKWLVRNNTDNLLELIDISDPQFSAEKYGLSKKDVDLAMHARLPNGEILTGVDAFIRIYQSLPKYRWLANLIALPGIRQALKVVYFIFARSRPYLPKRKDSVFCEFRK